jgi:hypothetical protein
MHFVILSTSSQGIISNLLLEHLPEDSAPRAVVVLTHFQKILIKKVVWHKISVTMRRLSSPCFALWVVAASAYSISSVQAFTAGKGSFLSSRPQKQQNQHQYQHTTSGTASAPSALFVVSPQEVDVPTSALSENQEAASAAAGSNAADLTPLTWDVISKLRFRELHKELNNRHLPVTGTTSQLRDRLREAAIPDSEKPECIVNEDGIEDDCEPVVSIVSKQ